MHFRFDKIVAGAQTYATQRQLSGIFSGLPHEQIEQDIRTPVTSGRDKTLNSFLKQAVKYWRYIGRSAEANDLRIRR
jgi:hypothetical protein